MQTMNNHRINDYRFGQVTIDGKRYHKDVIILPDRIIDGWWRERGHYLQVKDLDEIIKEEPEILVIGQGAYSRMQVSDEVHRFLAGREIELIALPSKEACEKYNELNQATRTAAAIHLTC
jgi:hypothetical protein